MLKSISLHYSAIQCQQSAPGRSWRDGQALDRALIRNGGDLLASGRGNDQISAAVGKGPLFGAIANQIAEHSADVRAAGGRRAPGRRGDPVNLS